MEKTARFSCLTPDSYDESLSDVVVLIMAAGSGLRFGDDTPKQYIKIYNKEILRYTVERFLAFIPKDNLRIVIQPSHAALYKAAIDGLDLPPPIHGGAERQDSVYAGVKAFNDMKRQNAPILIHDAVRPFFDVDDVKSLVKKLKSQSCVAACLARPVTDTLKYDKQKQGGVYVDRNDLWSLQTPQGFHYSVLRAAHEQGRDILVTDDTALVQSLGYDVSFLESKAHNLKITYPEDLKMAAKYIDIYSNEDKLETRTGIGYDVHSFDRQTQGPVILAGIEVPHDYKLKGHSDADVALHTITDALFGAMADGDIGSHFPPSDMQWKGKDSAFFLEYAVRRLEKIGGCLKHIDLVVICEKPKVTPHREAMRKRIAEICAVSSNRVSVKATTTERLGFTGRGEGIAAQAVVTIECPSND